MREACLKQAFDLLQFVKRPLTPDAEGLSHVYSESLRARVVGIASVKEDGHDSATLLLPDYTQTQKTHPSYIQSGAWT